MIKNKFDKIRENNPYWSSIICLNEALKNIKISNRKITNSFNELVEKDDYGKWEKTEAISFAISISKDFWTPINRG